MAVPSDPLMLADWRRRAAELYAEIRQLHGKDPAGAWRVFQARRNRLFKQHPQSPLSLAQRESFIGLPFFTYDSDWCVSARVDTAVTHQSYHVALPADGDFVFTRFARIDFSIRRQPFALDLYWVEGYGGGLFLPFRDATNQGLTYGGGRYLYDGIKGGDLGSGKETILLDFNFAYNPSCAYNDQWVCPLAPTGNWLKTAVTAGERIFPDKPNKTKS